MLQTIPRKNPELNDSIAVLDEPLIACQNNIQNAWLSLSQSDLEFIDGEITKCLDVRYYLENYHCIRTEHGLVKTFYPFWDHQEIVYEAMVEEYSMNGACLLIVLKPRQAGISTWVSSVLFHGTIFTPQTYSLQVSQNAETATHIYKMMYSAYQMLPWWLRPEYLFKQEGEYLEFQRGDEKQRLTDPGLGSAIQISNAQKMSGVAIGRTIRKGHFSEVSRWPDADIFTADIEPSMNAKDQFAVMESTAWGRNGLFYDHWRGSVDGDTGWRPVFIPVYRVKKYSLPIKGSFALTRDEEAFSANVLKETSVTITNEFWNWRRRRVRASIRSTGAPWAHFESYPISPEEAFQSSGICAFDRNSLMEQEMQNCCKPIWAGEIELVDARTAMINTDKIRRVADDEELPRRKGELNMLKRDRLYVWEWPESNEMYYVSGDTALGVPDGDYSVAEVFRAGRGKQADVQVAEWWGHCPPKQFSHICAALGFWYHGDGTAAEIAIEYQGPGITTGDQLVEIDYPNLYRPRHKDRLNQTTQWFHWITTIKTRDLGITNMNEALLANTVELRSKELLDEMHDFGSVMGTRFEGQGNHDDGCLAAMIGLYCLREAAGMFKQSTNSEEDQQAAVYDLKVYGVYDNLSRQRGQYNDKSMAEEVIKGKDGWTVRPVMICKANTIFSPIYNGGGAEHELRFKHGMHSQHILPDVVAAYKTVRGGIGGANDVDFDDF